MSVYRQYVLEAKQVKFVSATQKISNHRKELQKLQVKMQKAAKTLNTINSSKTTPPKLKTAKVQQEKALVAYIRASINHVQAQIKQLSNPE